MTLIGVEKFTSIVPRTLYAKLSTVLAMLLAAIGLMYALLSVSATRHYLQEVNQRFNRDLAQNLVADRNLVKEGQINEAALRETFHYYMTINPSIEIYLLDREGAILSYSADPGKVKRKRVSLGPIMAFLQGDDSFPLLGDDPRSDERRKAFSVTPVPSADHVHGFLYVILRGEQFDSVERAILEIYFLRLSGWAVAGSLVFGLLMGLGIFYLMTRRLHHLTEAMDSFRKSDFTAKVPFSDGGEIKSLDEIGRLETTFGQMAKHIIDQLNKLNRKDALRRELVAQVSHDLRTPLASLHGYLETLQIKATTLSQQKRSEYLSVALRHSTQLTRLVEDLFELAKLEAKETKPHAEPFSVAELVQDVLQDFQLKAQEKGVQLAMPLSDGVPFVIAEIGLIDRVLKNLLENALDHTPKGGCVDITLEAHGNSVIVNVTDSGCGIPAADLPHIFDLFYQSSNRHRGGQHAGLGLSTAKRILELHGSDIKVNTKMASGATFSFGLPIWRSQHNSFGKPSRMLIDNNNGVTK